MLHGNVTSTIELFSPMGIQGCLLNTIGKLF
jgi:hypothetical protein